MLATDVTIVRRPVTAQDDELIVRLFADSRPDLDPLPDELRSTLLDLQHRAQRAEYASAYPCATHDVIVADGMDVGRIVVDVSRDEVRVVDVVVAREHRRRGIAAAVLRDVLAQADERSLPVALSVWPTNHAALDLYTGLGFEAVAGAGAHVQMRRAAADPKDRP